MAYFVAYKVQVVMAGTLLAQILPHLIMNVKGHSILMEPPGRSSLWRLPEFNSSNPPVNYDDNQLYCGGFAVQHDQNHGKCGVCGDSYSDPRPRPNESGGKYDIGIISRKYSISQIIPTASVLQVNHRGFFEFSICARNSTVIEEEDCFNQYPLPLADGSGYRLPITENLFKKQGPNFINTTLQLPPNLRCSHCVFRWQYTTGNTWGACSAHDHDHDHHSAGVRELGCGPQETFRSCADISIE